MTRINIYQWFVRQFVTNQFGFLKNVSITLVVQFISIPISIILSVIIAHYLGTTGTGTFAVLTAFTGILIQFGNLGFHASNVYFVAKHKDLIKNIASNSFWTGLIIGSLLVAVSFITLYFYPKALGDIPLSYLIIVLVPVPFSLILLYFQNILLGQQKVVVYNIINLSSQVIILIVAGSLIIFFHKSIMEILIAQSTISVLICLALVLYVYRDNPFFFDFDIKLLKKMFSYGFIFYINTFLYYLVTRIDMLLINFFLNADAAGIYSVAVNYCGFLYMIPSTVGLILFPKLSAEMDSESGKYTCLVSRFTVVIMLISSIGSVIMFTPIIKVLYGEPFLPSIQPFLLLLPGTLFISIETIFAIYIAAINKIKILPVFWGVNVIINIILNIILIPRFGVSGAALVSTISYMLVTILVWVYFSRITNSKITDAFIIKYDDIKQLFK